MKTVLKVLTVLAAAAGAVYLLATYGDRIVAWAKKLLAACPCHNCCDVAIEEETPADAEEAAPAQAEETEEAVPAEAEEAEEAVPAEAVEAAPAEAPAEEPAAEIPENEPVAEENDFEG